MITSVEIVEGIRTPLLDVYLLVLSQVLQVVSERRKGSSIDADLLVQLKHLQEFDRVKSKQLKLSRVNRDILEISKLLRD